MCCAAQFILHHCNTLLYQNEQAGERAVKWSDPSQDDPSSLYCSNALFSSPYGTIHFTSLAVVCTWFYAILYYPLLWTTFTWAALYCNALNELHCNALFAWAYGTTFSALPCALCSSIHYFTCTSLHWTACTVMYCNALYCTAMNYTVMHCMHQ